MWKNFLHKELLCKTQESRKKQTKVLYNIFFFEFTVHRKRESQKEGKVEVPSKTSGNDGKFFKT